MKPNASSLLAVFVAVWILVCAAMQGRAVLLAAFGKCLAVFAVWIGWLLLRATWRQVRKPWRGVFLALIVFGGMMALAWQLAGNDPERRWRDAGSIIAGIAVAALLSIRWIRQPLATIVATQRRHRLVLSATFVPLSLLAGWIIASWVDRASQKPIALHPERFASGASEAAELRIGLALSGGGYRAALYHAGVLTALEKLQLRPVCLSSVSGGSIMSTFYAHGGAPEDFLAAVKAGRFHLKREMLNFFTATKLACPGRVPWLGVKVLPFGDYNRLDAQADLLDRLILRGSACGTPLPAGAPRLMVCATDVSRGWQLGFTADGLVIDGTARDRVLLAKLDAFPAGARWARLAAMSGAFPGAFPISSARVRLGLIEENMITDFRTMNVARIRPEQDPEIELSLADGGVIENLGLRLLLAAHLHGKLATDGAGIARGMRLPPGKVTGAAEAYQRTTLNFGSGFRDLPPEWRLDLALFSNGGQMLSSRVEEGTPSLGRVLDIATGLHAVRDEEALRFATERRKEDDVLVHGFSPAYLGDPPDIEMLGGENAAAARERGRRTALPLWSLADMLEANGLLETVLSIHPQGDTVAAELATFRARWAALPEAEQRAAGRRFPDEHPILRDVSACLAAFVRTSTLEDQVPPADADAIYRLGQYAVYLRYDRLKMVLELARAKKRAAADSAAEEISSEESKPARPEKTR